MIGHVAYEVRAEDGTGTIVFAPGAPAARAKGADELDCHVSDINYCRRQPWADQYREARKVPVSAMLANGWGYECAYCGTMVYQDGYADGEDDGPPVADDDHAYCSADHRGRRWAEQRAREALVSAAVEACMTRFHGIAIKVTEVYVQNAVEPRDRTRLEERPEGAGMTATCRFTFPGQEGRDATWELGDSSVYVDRDDRVAFRCAMASAGYVLKSEA